MATLLTPASAGRLAAMARAAAPLADRLRGDVPTVDDGGATAARRLDAWCTAVVRGDAPSFARRLAWDGLDAASLARALAPVDGTTPGEDDDEATLPRWARLVADAWEDAEDGGDARPAGAAVAFEEALLPLVARARRELAARAGAAHVQLAPAAHAALERALLERLAHVAHRLLATELAVFQACRMPAGVGALLVAAPADPRAAYRAFCDSLRGAGMLALLDRYPVAARLLGTVATLWVDAVAELLARLAADRDEVERTLAGGRALGPAVDATASISDPHEGGRGVVILGFADGTRVVYKPRPLDMEGIFGELLAWLSADPSVPSLRTLALVERPTHGWLEYASPAACDDDAAAGRFFQRCGALLAVAYALNGSDFHFENLIAAGEHPLLIDLETLIGPRFELVEQLAEQGLGGEAARRRLVNSVIATRMLPTLKCDAAHRVDDVGALGRRELGPPGHNVPRVGDEPHHATAYAADVIAGFDAAYRSLLARRARLGDAGGFLDRLRGRRVRFILRNTSLYATAIERTLHPRWLRDGAERAFELDVLARTMLPLDERPAIWPALAAEQASLEQLDVPYFAVATDSRDLPLPTGEVVRDVFRASAHEEVRRRLDALSDADREAQCALVRATFAAAGARELAPPGAPAAPRAAMPAAAATTAIAYADHVAAGLLARAHADEGGTPGWITVAYKPLERRHAVQAASLAVLDGYAGLALFLAARARATGRAADRAAALGALHPLRARMAELERLVRMRRASDVGAGTGLGGAVWALARIAALAGEPALLDDARRVARAITPACVAVEDAHDVTCGSAGAVLGLLALHDATGDADALERAAALGAHLLARRRTDDDGCAWPGIHGAAEPGLAHGQAGIAMALARLARATDDGAFADAAAAALAWERRALGADLAGAADGEARAAWSRGLTGAALARLAALDAGLPAGAAALARAEVEQALAAVTTRLGSGFDTLAAGDAARVDLLLVAARVLSRPALAAQARDAAGALLARASRPGGARTGWEAADGLLGLAHGEAGIAYQLLRAADPAGVPSVLVWE